MEHAGAKSVRGNLQDSVDEFFGKFRSTTQQTRWFSAFHNPALDASTRHWASALGSERLLRNAIPFLIALLLIIVAATRISTLHLDSEQIDRNTKQELAFIGQIAAERLSHNSAVHTAFTSPALSDIFLKEALPKQAKKLGREYFLLDSQSKIAATFPRNLTKLGAHLSSLTGGDLSISTLGKPVAAQTVLPSPSDPTLAYYQTVYSLDKKPIGAVMITQSVHQLYAQWRQRVKMNVTLFLALSTVLVVFLYAYFAQGTKARDAEQLFLETNARFDTALSRGHCGLWDWDLSRGRIVWSSSMYQMLGMDADDRVLGYGELSTLLHPDDADLTELANAAFKTREKSIDYRFRMLHVSGTWVWLRMRAELVFTKNSVPHLIGIAVDISEQEMLKQRSLDADIRLRDAIENISEAFVLWDSKRRLVMCNTKYQQLYSLPTSAVESGGSHDEIMAKSRKPRIRNQVSTGQNSTSGTQTFEAQLEDGRWLQISERRTQDGGFVSIGTDITQIKRNEEKLLDSERRLKSTVADQRKTQQKTELQAQNLVELAEKYNDERNKAEAASRAKSEFLANISHELRTPLNAIIGFSEIMQNKMFGPMGSEKYDEYADDIHQSGNFLLAVINDVLDMSKIEAGRFQLNPEKVELDGLLDETLRIIKIQTQEAKINLTQDIPNKLSIKADRRAVKQILINLLSNAVKFTNENGNISVTAKSSKSSVNICIKDDGIGISKDALNRIGMPFEQVQDQFTKNHKGSGLGLAIAKSLTSLHGGKLEIHSIEGEGTTVTVRLPVRCDTTNSLIDKKAA